MPFIRTVALAWLLVLAPAGLIAQQGVTDTAVTFGQVAPFEGSAAALGLGMRAGITAAFAEANEAGGIHGRRIDLRSADDGYEPTKSAAATRAMLADDDIFGLIGPVGTPTSAATQPLAAAAGVPFVGAFTGAGFLRNPALGNVVNIRASYDAETEAWIRHLVDERGFSDIAIIYQDDSFGRAGLSGVQAALDRRGMALAVEGTFMRNTLAVRSALLDIRAARPEAVVMVGPYAPMAAFIRLSRSIDFEPVFVNISFVGSEALAAELGPDGEGVIVSQVVPLPWDSALPVVADYQQALAAHQPDEAPGFVSLEGYIVGRLTLAALDAAGPDLKRDGFLGAVGQMAAQDIGGLTLGYGPQDNQGLDDVFLTTIDATGGFSALPRPDS